MSTVYLLGEDHSTAGRDLWALGMLLKIEKEAPPLLGISFELDRSAYQRSLADYKLPLADSPVQLIMELARKRQIPCIATDDRDSSDAINELNLEKRINSDPSLDLVESYRILTRSNMRMRNEQTAKYISEFLEGKAGSLAHRCGLFHMAGLSRRLGQKGISVKTYDTRRGLEADKPRLYQSKQNDILLSTQHVFVCLAQNGAPLDFASARIAQRWPDGYARALASITEEGGSAINYTNTPPITVIETTRLDTTPALAEHLRTLGDKDLVESFAFPWLERFDEGAFQNGFSGSFSRVIGYPSKALAPI